MNPTGILKKLTGLRRVQNQKNNKTQDMAEVESEKQEASVSNMICDFNSLHHPFAMIAFQLLREGDSTPTYEKLEPVIKSLQDVKWLVGFPGDKEIALQIIRNKHEQEAELLKSKAKEEQPTLLESLGFTNNVSL